MPTEAQPAANRRFVLKALGLTAAGLAMGSGGAWIKGRLDEGAAAEAAAQNLQIRLADTATTRAALDQTIAAVQSQLAEAQSQLAVAVSQNAQLAASLSEAQKESSDLKTQLASTQGQLSAANDQLARLKELAGLYALLEGIDLDALVQTGLAAVASGLATTLGGASLLNEGLSLAHNLLASFEKTLPDFDAAMTWLGEQVVQIKLGLYAIETAAQRTLDEALTGLEAVFGGFVAFVLDHLPFNIGENVRNTLSATQSLLTRQSDMADGITDQVLGKISRHVGDGPQNWKHTLVRPIREKALTPTARLLMHLKETDTAFATSLKDPVGAALDQRAALREKIAAFRAAHNL